MGKGLRAYIGIGLTLVGTFIATSRMPADAAGAAQDRWGPEELDALASMRPRVSLTVGR